MNEILMFHGRECPHCKAMMPLVDKLEAETGLKVERLEIWHNEQNADRMRSYRDILAPKCGGQLRTPTFFKPATNAVLCGEASYETLKSWAQG